MSTPGKSWLSSSIPLDMSTSDYSAVSDCLADGRGWPIGMAAEEMISAPRAGLVRVELGLSTFGSADSNWPRSPPNPGPSNCMRV
jgi:hypothetical protein